MRGPLKWPQMLQVDPGHEFMGAVTKEMEKHITFIRRGRTEIHRDQAIVERFNRTLAARLFGHQYADEMRLPEGQQSNVWVKRLPEVVSALNNEVTSLTGKKPTVAIEGNAVAAKPSTKYLRPVGQKEKRLPSLVSVRYLFQPGDLEGGVKRATDPIWSLKVLSAASCVKNCWLFLQTQSYHQSNSKSSSSAATISASVNANCSSATEMYP